MTPSERFANFHAALKKENEIWYDGLGLVYPNKDIPLAVKKVWLTMHGEGKITRSIDWVYARNLVQKTLTWQETMANEGFEKCIPVDDHPEALKGEARLAKLKEFENILLQIGEPEKTKHDNKVFHVAQQIKKIDYTPPTPQEIYKSDRHFAYVKYCFDPKTAEPNSDWMKEEEFDLLYDEGLI